MSSSTLPLALKILGTTRLIVGVSSWLFPRQSCQILAFYTPPPGAHLIVRLFGARDGMLATVLMLARTSNEQRIAVTAGIIVDGLDVVASVISWLAGETEAIPASAVGGGAIIFLVLAMLGRGGLKVI